MCWRTQAQGKPHDTDVIIQAKSFFKPVLFILIEELTLSNYPPPPKHQKEGGEVGRKKKPKKPQYYLQGFKGRERATKSRRMKTKIRFYWPVM